MIFIDRCKRQRIFKSYNSSFRDRKKRNKKKPKIFYINDLYCIKFFVNNIK